MDKDSKITERNEDSETRMTAFQRAMAEKNGNRPSDPPPAVRKAPPTPAEQTRPAPAPTPAERMRPVPLVPSLKQRRAPSPGSDPRAAKPSNTVGAAPGPAQRKAGATPSVAETKKRAAVPKTLPRSRPQGASAPPPKNQVHYSGSTEKKQGGKAFLSGILKFDGGDYTGRKMSAARRIALIVFTLAAVVTLVFCTWGSYSLSDTSIRESSQINLANKSDSKNYRIVYSTEDSFGADAAASLRSHLMAKTGASLSIVSDTEAPTKNEIRIGYTRRAPDSYITSLGSLGKNGYAIIFGANGGVDLIAFSRVGAEAAIMCFTDGYGVSYLAGNLNFASSSNLAFVSRDGTEPETSLYESKLTLGFGSDRKFKMLVFSDTDINTNTIFAMETMLDAERPDLVILAGDVSGGLTTKSELEEYLKVLCAPMEERRIAWCHTFGEQDCDAGLSAALQNEVYSSFKYCVSKTDFESFGTSSYFLPVFSTANEEKGSAPLFGIWMLGQTGLISNSPVSPGTSDSLLSSMSGEGIDYGYVTQSHVDWMSDSASMMKKDKEGGIPSVAVTHTPIDEFNIIAENPDKCSFVGVMAEKISSSPIQSGLFAALLESKSVLGLYCGHDHLNNFSGRYMGIELGYVSSIGYDGYGHGGTFETNNSARGGRIIEATLMGESVSVTSRIAFASDYGVTRE